MLRATRIATFFALIGFIGLPTTLAQPRDGTYFLHGLTYPRSEGAPSALDDLAYLIGHWDVQFTTYPTDSTTTTMPAQAVVTTMNRGHAYMERLHAPDFNGSGMERNTITMIAYTPGVGQWTLGTVDSYTESVALFNGAMRDGALVVRDAQRRSGSTTLVHYRLTLTPSGADQFTQVVETSTDHGATWRPRLTKRYTRRSGAPDDVMAGSTSFGQAAPGLPDEARQFDFLVGDWTATHALTTGNGQTLRWAAHATAGYVLNGHAVMEYNWFDTDPSLPEAATTIVRIYNRAMRRWDCLYLTNRGNSPLFFGGTKDGGDIVLHPFLTDTAAPISRYVFHRIEDDQYAWYGANSTDRGASFNRNWVIDFKRND